MPSRAGGQTQGKVEECINQGAPEKQNLQGVCMCVCMCVHAHTCMIDRFNLRNGFMVLKRLASPGFAGWATG